MIMNSLEKLYCPLMLAAGVIAKSSGGPVKMEMCSCIKNSCAWWVGNTGGAQPGPAEERRHGCCAVCAAAASKR